jgi:hypothetical protein
MEWSSNMKWRIFYAFFLGAFMAIVMLSGCATTAPELVQKRVDPEAQQQYYDLGLKFYVDENYGEAKNAFQLVIKNGADTALGIKARDGLKKTIQALKTLKEIEQKQ